MGFRQWQSQNTAGEPKVPSLVLRWQRQWNQRAVTLRPPPVLKPPDSRDTLFPEPLTPTYPTPLWIEFPWCSEGLTSLRGRVSGFQGLRGIAHCKREEIDGAPTLDPQLQNSGVPLKLLLGCHVLKTKDCKPEKTPGSKYSSTSGLSPRGHLERQAEFHASTQDEA